MRPPKIIASNETLAENPALLNVPISLAVAESLPLPAHCFGISSAGANFLI
jgi:hypothetical protein